MIVVLVLLVLTATATYTSYAVTAEVQGAGAQSKAFQTELASQSLLESSIDWIEYVGPAATYQHILYNSNVPQQMDLIGLEQANLADGQLGARIYINEIENVMNIGNNSGITADYILDATNFNPNAPYIPHGVIDIYDVYMYTGDVAGSRSDGYGYFKFLKTTFTTRIKVETRQVPIMNNTIHDTLIIDRHTSTNTSRATLISGPFNL